MAKLVLSLNQVNIAEYSLDKARLTIGRKDINDIQIDNLAVSGMHAVILYDDNQFVIEDMNSTNGTLVNNQSIKKHALQDSDVIAVGKHQLKYINQNPQSPLSVIGHQDTNKKIISSQANTSVNETPSLSTEQQPSSESVVTSPPSSDILPIPLEGTLSGQNSAKLDTPLLAAKPSVGLGAGLNGKMQVLNGSGSGRELLLSKALTTLGKPGVQVAVITKRVNGYYLTHVEGHDFPVVNGRSIGAQAQLLVDCDVVELAGVKMQFNMASI